MGPGTIRVLDLYPFDAESRGQLDAVSSRLRIEHRPADSQSEVDALLDPELEVLLSSYAPSDLRRTPSLRWVASVTAGIEQIVEKDPWSGGVTVTNGSGLHAVAMGEYVVASILEVTQRVPDRLGAQRQRRWPAWRSEDWVHFAGRRARGSTVAIVGYGSVGREIARLLHGLGMRIVAVKAEPGQRADLGHRERGTGDPEGTIPERVVGVDGLDGALADADFVVLTVPLTQRTRGLVDRRFLSAMRRDAWLVNVGRGGLADEEVLLEALRSGGIAGAVLDVFLDEPLPPSSGFWDLPNVIITPHLAGAGGFDGFWRLAVELMADNLRRYVAGETLLNVVEKARSY